MDLECIITFTRSVVIAKIIRGFMVQTFHSRKFASIEDLTAQKAYKNKTVSVVIPAFNEAATIGPIISRIRSVLMEKSGFVDEIIVMDGISEDETVKVALEAGAEVYNVADVQPSVLHRGKGVAMWKSQFVTRGDIIIFIDSDILDFDERFICGLAGPLLYHDELYFAKAFYKRPLLLGTGVYENQGGELQKLWSVRFYPLWFRNWLIFISLWLENMLCGEISWRVFHSGRATEWKWGCFLIFIMLMDFPVLHR